MDLQVLPISQSSELINFSDIHELTVIGHFYKDASKIKIKLKSVITYLYSYQSFNKRIKGIS